jgi:serine/threonine protein kinase
MPGVTSAVGRYDILRELGRGGMATVYLARQIDLNRFVALKELDPFRTTDPGFAQRFLREAHLAGSLSHPNIVTVHDYFEDGGRPYIAMEYLERGSLRPYVGRMTLAQIGGVLEGTLAGLAHAAKRDVVHRDLKPENLLVTGDGRVKIADFGIAKATNTLQPGAALTSAGVAVGTPNYMAPEQAMAMGVGPATDLYSVGIMAFEFFIGLPPFSDTKEPLGVLLRQVNEAIPPVSELDPGIDAGLSYWIERMVAKDPAGRPQSAAEAWDGIEERLIALLGPRWGRDAGLPPPPNVHTMPPGPATPIPPGAPAGPLTEAHLGMPIDSYPPPSLRGPVSASDSPTKPLDNPLREATVPPLLPQPTVPMATPASRRRARSIPRTVAVAVMLIAVAGTAAAHLAGGPSSPAPVQDDARVRTDAGAGHTGGAKPEGTVTAGARQTAGAGPGGAKEATSPSPTPAGLGPGRAAAASGAKAVRGGSLAAKAKSARALARRYDAAATQVARLDDARVADSPTVRLLVALRVAAAAYRNAAAAAAAGNANGYGATSTTAAAAKRAADAALAGMTATSARPQADPTRSQSSSPAGSQPSPQPRPQPVPQPAPPCAGDSQSDDPSDDSCEP